MPKYENYKNNIETKRVCISLDTHTIKLMSEKAKKLRLSRSLYLRKLIEKDNK